MPIDADMRAAATCAFVALTVLAAPPASRAADSTATPGRTAIVPLPAPQRTGGPIYLDVRISAYRPPARGSVDAALAIGNATRETEIGRVTIFPNQAFTAGGGESPRSYRFNVTSALAAFPAGAPLELRMRLVPIDPQVPIEGAQMTLGGAEFHAGGG
jgi:hypothetical protein